MTEQYHYDDDDDDEDGFRRATKSKVRSASVCFSSTRSDRDRRHSVRAADAECFDARFTSTTNSSPPFTPTAVATATSDHREVKHFRKRGRPACRSQSVRVSGGKSLPRRARPLDRDGDTDVDTDPDAGRGASTWSRTAAISDPKLYGHDSGSEICAPFPSWRPGPSCGRQSNSNSNTNSNSIHHSQCHSHGGGGGGGGGGDGNCRKCTNAAVVTACSDVPATKTRHRHQHQHQHQPVPKNDTRAADENSYRLRSFSFTAKGLVNRGDSFKKRHGRRSSVSAAKYKASGGEEIDDTTSATETTTNSAPSAASACADSGLNDDASGSVIAGASTSTYNVSVMGATGVGKTSLISQFMTSECINAYDRDRDRDEPCQQTQTVSILLNGEESELRFHELKPTKVLRHKYAADAFLVMYSVVDKSTFQYAETELVRLQDCNALHTRPAILVANKIDLARSRTVSSQDGKCLACTFRVKHLEISVGINHNVDELLVGILHQIRLKKQRCDCKQQTAAAATATASIAETATAHRWYKNRAVIRATMKARQMFTWMFGREDSKFKNCENLHTL